jgi:hypothetical protein
MLNNVNKVFIFMSQKLDFSKRKSGVISDLRLRAKIGRFVSHKPTFFLEDEVKKFSKISGYGDFLC